MSPHRILVADDNADHALLTVDALHSAHGESVDVRVARDGREALEIVFDERWIPELVLLDIQMPIVDGFEVLRRLKNDDALRAVPVVMLTSSADERDVRRSYGLGSNSYVTKPVGGTALRSLVAQIPSYWFGVNTPPRVEVKR
jgi:two-component system, response regulator